MSNKIKTGGTPSFGHFLEYLGLNNFSVGVEHYFRVQQVLDRVGEDFLLENAEPLKPLLRPIFASTAEEQQRFTKLYDDYVEYCRKTLVLEDGGLRSEVDNELTDRSAWPEKQRSRSTLRILTDYQDTARRRPRLSLIAAVAFGIVALIAILLFSTTAPRDRTVNNTQDMLKGPSPSPDANVVPTPSFQSPTPTEQDYSDGQNPPSSFYFALAAAMIFLLLLYSLLRHNLRRFNPSSYENKHPPFKWPLHVTAPPVRLYDSEEFRRAARLLHRRQADEFLSFDLQATISATISALGYPNLRFRQATRVPEYLALIERVSPRDHQARLFDEMVDSLKREGLIVTRYFFGDDPLSCCDPSGELCVRLERLKQRHGSHRLLLFANGEHLLDPVTGRLAQWANVFSNWHIQAILTPEQQWAWREQELSKRFVVVPATAQGLATFTNHIDSLADYSGGTPSGNVPHPLLREPEAPLPLDATPSHLDWLCSCAIYSELYWELTLLLGSLPSMPKGIVNEESLLRMSRLPWFRKGFIPEAERTRLLEALQPTRADKARQVLVKLLEASPPPPNTFAFDAYNLDLALQRWLLLKDKKSLNALRRALNRLPSLQISRDRVLVGLLKAVPHKFFGGRLPAIFYRRGLPALGLSLLAHAALFTVLLATMLVIARLWAEYIPQRAYSPFIVATPTPEVPPPTPLQTSWSGTSLTGQDSNGKSASLRIYILSSETKWQTNSIDIVTLNGRDRDLGGYIKEIDLSSARAIVCVGLASSTGGRIQAEALAQRRMEKLLNLVRQEINSDVPLYGLNLGQFNRKSSNPLDSGSDDTQRPVVIIEVTGLEEGVDLGEALRSALAIHSNPLSPFDLENYSQFDLFKEN